MSWLDEWWAERRARVPDEDPGVPMYYGTCAGEPTEAPWSAVLGAREKLPRVINLQRLKERVVYLMRRGRGEKKEAGHKDETETREPEIEARRGDCVHPGP